MVNYYLMHKNDICGELVYDEKEELFIPTKTKIPEYLRFLGIVITTKF